MISYLCRFLTLEKKKLIGMCKLNKIAGNLVIHWVIRLKISEVIKSNSSGNWAQYEAHHNFEGHLNLASKRNKRWKWFVKKKLGPTKNLEVEIFGISTRPSKNWWAFDWWWLNYISPIGSLEPSSNLISAVKFSLQCELGLASEWPICSVRPRITWGISNS